MNQLRTLMLSCVLSLACGAVPGALENLRAEEATRVLLIGHQPDHPWGSHMYLHTADMLAKCLKLNGDIQTTVSDGWPKDPNQLTGVDTIVIYTSPAAELLLDGPYREQAWELMKQGCGLVTIHWASTVRQENLDRLGPAWMKLLGGTWISNVGLSIDTSQLKQLRPDHPICRGWNDYEIRDEFYLNPQITDEAQPLLQVSTKGQEVIVGWAYERPAGGRSYATTLGHFYDNFQREEFRRTIVNAVLWTARQDVPPDGARVHLSEAELALPPKP